MEQIEVPLTQGLVTVLDLEDWERLCNLVGERRWQACRSQHGNLYAQCHVRSDEAHRSSLMHRLILGAPKGVGVDHRDGYGLNNRRENLRLATPAQNTMNMRKLKAGKSSRFKGVWFVPGTQKWVAYIYLDGTKQHLGTFALEEDAAAAYDKAAVLHFGEFACTNAEITQVPQS